MPTNTLQVVWRPDDAREVFERAATLAAAGCPAYLTMHGMTFACDNTTPHTTHTSSALQVRWVDGRL
jgi:hypothetical protein